MLLFPKTYDWRTTGPPCLPLSFGLGFFGDIHPAVVPGINCPAGPAAVSGEVFLSILPPLVGADLTTSCPRESRVERVMQGFLRGSLQQTFSLERASDLRDPPF